MTGLRERFAAHVAQGERADLARAALDIACIAYPDLDPAPTLRRLDELAAGIRPRLRPHLAPEAVARVVTMYLFQERGFRGNTDDYYDPRNSFLNDVLERRTGIPISLSILFLEVARRLGLGAEGVGFPGHFLVRVAGGRGLVLLDPFHGGCEVGEAELLERLRDVYGARGPAGRLDRVPPDFLTTTDTLGILARTLRNLLRIYSDTDHDAEALLAVDLLLVIHPESAEDVRTRGFLHERLECFTAARADLARYLELAPGAADADPIRARIVRLQRGEPTVH